jgi:hypothetical protein
MRSPADRLRVERVLRAIGLAALAAWILLALRPSAGRTERASSGALPQSLERWTRSDPIASAAVSFDTIPDDTHTAWLRALRSAGVPVHWSSETRAPLAVETYPAADPAGGHVVLMSADGVRRRVLSDALGPIDTTDVASARVTAVEGELTVESARQRARVAPAASMPMGRVFVAGSADWESKFVIAALEESGWLVSARLAVGPGQDVVQGAAAALDTASYAAVVLLDSTAAERTRGIERFVRSGGGLVLAGDASRAASIAVLSAWRPMAREVAPLGSSAEDSSWRGMSRVPFTPVAARSVVLERRAGNATLIARRHFAGRVVAVGYDQSWRWRMTGGDAAVIAHRTWWSRLVSSVALRPAAARSVGAAPLASLYDALGEPSLPAVSPDWLGWTIVARLLGVLALAALVTEWTLRRARGGA